MSLRYRELPSSNRQAARQTYRLWNDNPPKLRVKKVRDVYSIRIGATGYRAIAVDVPGGFLWIWIGPHDAYEQLLTA